MNCETCPRSRDDCTPISNIASDSTRDREPESFICVGYNRPEDREEHVDRFTLCWKNEAVDERSHFDKRDLTDTMCVLAGALSVDENIKDAEGMTDEDMNAAHLKP